MEMAPIIEALNRFPKRFQHLLVHTGQQYDERMSKTLFDDLGMPKPDIDLEVGSGSHAEQTHQSILISLWRAGCQSRTKNAPA